MKRLVFLLSFIAFSFFACEEIPPVVTGSMPGDNPPPPRLLNKSGRSLLKNLQAWDVYNAQPAVLSLKICWPYTGISSLPYPSTLPLLFLSPTRKTFIISGQVKAIRFTVTWVRPSGFLRQQSTGNSLMGAPSCKWERMIGRAISPKRRPFRQK